MADYTALADEELVKENLLNNSDYMSDVRGFLAERNNEVYSTRAEEFDAMLEHMRKQKVGNEFTVLGDLHYATSKDTSEESKRSFGRITNVFDRLQGEDDWLTPRGLQKLGDYAEGVLKSPSTVIGVFTGGGAKAAQLVAAQGLRYGIRKILATSLRGAIPAMAVEGTAGAITGAAEQQVRTEIGLEGDWKRGAAIGLGAGVLAGTLGGGVPSLISAVRARKQGVILAASRASQEATKERVLAQTKSLLTDPENKKLSVIFSNKLKKLDELEVAAGLNIKRRLGPGGEDLVAGLSPETREGIIGAGIELSRMKDRSGKAIFSSDDITTRITERVATAIREGDLTTDQIQRIASKYNLTMNEFGKLLVADVSEAARLMRGMRTIKEALTSRKVLESLTEGFGPETAAEAADANMASNLISFAWAGVKNFDKMRIGMMTAQPATTIRNAFNVGLRLPLHMIEYLFTGGTPKEALKIPYNLFDKSSSELFATAFSDAVPEVSKRIFRGAMDIEYSIGSTSLFARAGRGVNYFNTKVDNAVKKTLLLGEFRKIAGGSDKLNDIISRGEFKTWIGKNEDAVTKAIKDSLSVVYQKGYSRNSSFMPEKFAGNLIHFIANSNLSPFLTPFVPFPRYIVNQAEFVYKHMPILGLVDPLYALARRKKLPAGVLGKRIGEQVTGLGMLYGAMQYRSLQGPETAWNEYKDDQGRVTNITALLGPFAPYVFLADIIYRMSEGNNKHMFPLADESTKEFDFNQVDTQEAVKSFLGVAVRGGTGLYILDELFKSMGQAAEGILSDNEDVKSEALWKIGARFAADYANTLTIPLGLFRDLEATFDPEGRTLMDNQRVDIGKLFFNQALRTLPNTEAVRNTEEFFGVSDSFSSILNAARGEQFEQEFPGGGGRRTRFMPAIRQITGLTPTYGFEGKPVLEKEFTRLGITRQEYFRRHKDPGVTREMKKFMGDRADKEIRAFIKGKKYKAGSLVEQRDMLIEETKKWKSRARKHATLVLRMDKGQAGINTAKAAFDALPKYRKVRILAEYRKRHPDSKGLREDQAYNEGLDMHEFIK